MNNNLMITDGSGRFYAGMTRQKAIELDREKSWWRRDFHDIDKNKDGVLSVEEIFNERDRRAKNSNYGGIAFAAFTVLEQCLSKESAGWKVLDLLFNSIITFSCFNDAHKINKGTKEYKELLAKQNQLNETA